MNDTNNSPPPSALPTNEPSTLNPNPSTASTPNNTPAIQTGGLQNYITSPESPQSGTQSATGKLIATLFSLVILVGGVLAGVFLVRQQQEIRSNASEQECIQSANCIIIDNPDESGSYKINGIIYDVYLTDENANIFGAGINDSGCYKTTIEGDSLTWEKVGTQSECNNLVNIQIWMIEIPQEAIDPIVSQCRNIIIYDSEWNVLDSEILSLLSAGDEIKISADTTTSAGSIDQAIFTVNGEAQEPTSLKKPGTNELYIDYIILEGTTNLDIEVQLYHSTFGWF